MIESVNIEGPDGAVPLGRVRMAMDWRVKPAVQPLDGRATMSPGMKPFIIPGVS